MAGLATLLALSAPALAGSFSISPLRVDFAETSGTASLTVRNEDAAAAVVQTQAMAWSQEGGKDALSPSRDLLISPAVFTLQPGGSQLIRVALRRSVDPARELSYRLIVQEVPQTAAPGFTGLQVALKLSVPIFVAPTAPAEPQVTWAASRDASGKLSVTARNDGAAHARIHNFALKTADGTAKVLEQPSLSYVLPGAIRQWSFGDNNNTRPDAKSVASPGKAGQYRLEGTTDRGSFATELTLTAD
ncbi:MAG: molecular chaperone [Gammaproteobacteria bacterium]|nr:molecular chaperone [Gammaproteobacteria bacterium]